MHAGLSIILNFLINQSAASLASHQWVRVKRPVSSAIPHVISLFRFCTAGLKNLIRVTINKLMKMQYINGIIRYAGRYRWIFLIFCRYVRFFCLFFWSFSSHSRIFHSFRDVTIAIEELQILTYARQLWPLSSEGSLACHTYCDTGNLFIMVISEDCIQIFCVVVFVIFSSHLKP